MLVWLCVVADEQKRKEKVKTVNSEDKLGEVGGVGER
jgi:hypothetical protein